MKEKLTAEFIKRHEAGELAIHADKGALQKWFPKAMSSSYYGEAAKVQSAIMAAFVDEVNWDEVKSEMAVLMVKEA